MDGLERRDLGGTGKRVSVLALGGHEYYDNGQIKGLADDPEHVILPGYTQPGFGEGQRREIVRAALDLGINYFDITFDPELEAIGRNLRELGAKDPMFVQTRPQGMCYGYDVNNQKMADFPTLEQEVDRLIELSGRDKIDILNFGFEASALVADDVYLDKIADNVAALKDFGKIGHAACDSLLSGEEHYLRMMRAGCFDVVWLNFNILNPYPAEEILPLAHEMGMGVVAREAFVKGKLFEVASESKVEVSHSELSEIALRWLLQHSPVSAVAVGVRNAEQLKQNAAAVRTTFGVEDQKVLEQLTEQESFSEARAEQREQFRGE